MLEMNPMGRPANPLIAELLRALGAKDYSDIMPAISALQEQAAVDGLLDKPVEEVEKERDS